jgi:hypothetical protein
MVSGYDMTFAAALEARLRLVLQGDTEKQVGLYRQILSCPDFSTYQRINGQILAYENVLTMMREVARRMNDGEEPVRERRAGMN